MRNMMALTGTFNILVSLISPFFTKRTSAINPHRTAQRRLAEDLTCSEVSIYLPADWFNVQLSLTLMAVYSVLMGSEHHCKSRSTSLQTKASFFRRCTELQRIGSLGMKYNGNLTTKHVPYTRGLYKGCVCVCLLGRRAKNSALPKIKIQPP